MRLRYVVARSILPVIILGFLSQPATANDVQGPDGGVMLLTAGAFMVSGANLVTMTLADGSTAWGIAGVVIGAGLAVYAPIVDTENDWEAFVGIGAATAFIGGANILVARNGWNDPELLGMRLRPAAGSLDGERWYGLELTSR